MKASQSVPLYTALGVRKNVVQYPLITVYVQGLTHIGKWSLKNLESHKRVVEFHGITVSFFHQLCANQKSDIFSQSCLRVSIFCETKKILKYNFFVCVYKVV